MSYIPADGTFNDLIIKKLQGKPFTTTAQSGALEAPGSTFNKVFNNNIYAEDIPTSSYDPVTDSSATTVDDINGRYLYDVYDTNQTFIKYYKRVRLGSSSVVPGQAFKFIGNDEDPTTYPTNILLNGIASYGNYTITIEESSNGVDFSPISSSNSSKAWWYDPASGYVTFFVKQDYVTSNDNAGSFKPYITFWRYEGDMGIKLNNIDGDLAVTGNVGIGTTVPESALDISTGTLGSDTDASLNYVRFQSINPNRSYLDIYERRFNAAGDWQTASTRIQKTIDTTKHGYIEFDPPSNGGGLAFGASNDEKMRILSNGNVGIGTTVPGYTLDVNGYINTYRLYLDQNWHLESFDGGQVSLMVFLYNGASKGYISANGFSGKLNFTGQHRTFIENVLHTDASNNQGLIVCANKNTYMSMSNKLEKGNKAITQNESLPLVSLSTKSKDKSCFGVISESEDPQQRSDKFGNFVTPYEKEDGDTRIYINSVGEGAVWVSNKNGSLESGDYITTSDIPGYGEKQDDDILHNYTVAKITMDCDFNPQLQPSEIILKQETLDASGNTIYENVLDDNGMLQWTNELDGSGNIVYEYLYNLRYLDLSGNRYSKDDYDTKLSNNEEVYIAAYVGCTYHCG